MANLINFPMTLKQCLSFFDRLNLLCCQTWHLKYFRIWWCLKCPRTISSCISCKYSPVFLFYISSAAASSGQVFPINIGLCSQLGQQIFLLWSWPTMSLLKYKYFCSQLDQQIFLEMFCALSLTTNIFQRIFHSNFYEDVGQLQQGVKVAFCFSGTRDWHKNQSVVSNNSVYENIWWSRTKRRVFVSVSGRSRIIKGSNGGWAHPLFFEPIHCLELEQTNVFHLYPLFGWTSISSRFHDHNRMICPSPVGNWSLTFGSYRKTWNRGPA